MQTSDTLLSDGPAIVLVEPQLGENIGTAARAMANFGLKDLRIVNPREGWPNERANAAASRADHVIARARVFPTVEAAVADLGFLLATTARSRALAKPVLGPKEAAAALRPRAAADIAGGILFGRERIGLMNEELALADAIVTLPVDPEYASLNIAQAVLILAYEWRLSGFSGEAEALPFGRPDDPPATKAEMLNLFEHFEAALDAATFFRPPERRPSVVEGLRAMLQRAALTGQEVRTLRGMIAAIERRPTRPRERGDGTLTTERGDET